MAGREWLPREEWWQGGRTFKDRHGRKRWVIERMEEGIRYAITLESKDPDSAKAELALFERDPAGYRTAKHDRQAKVDDAVILDDKSIDRVAEHLRKAKCSSKYVLDTINYLGVWAEDLKGRDLRALRLKDLLKALSVHDTARQKRIAALKTFTAFYRETLATLEAREDPTLALMVPQSTPKKRAGDVGYSAEVIEKLYAHVHDWERETGRALRKPRKGFGDPQAVRDLLLLRATQGMHESEIQRLAQGQATLTPVNHEVIKGTVEFWHKNGINHTVSVDAQGWAAAKRLHAHREIMSRGYLLTSLRFASEKAKISEILPGQLRHSFATLASTSGQLVRITEGGVDLASIAAQLGHIGGTRTTALHYLGKRVPPLIRVPLRLVHPDDPT